MLYYMQFFWHPFTPVSRAVCSSNAWGLGLGVQDLGFLGLRFKVSGF